MGRIGLFYGTKAGKTASVAAKIKEEFGDVIEIVAVENARQSDFEVFDTLIVGTSTWFDGELPSYWDEIVPGLPFLNLKGKKVAVFGLGDQVNYPDNFVDGIGMLADGLVSAGAILIGFTSPEGYTFNNSKALKNNKFSGLAIDVENQPEKTEQRVKDWCNQLKTVIR